MTIAVTGHRPGKLGGEWNGIGYYSDHIRSYLQGIINEYYEDHQLTLISGMALGVDMIWAELAIDNHLPFIAAIPCINQESRWSHRQQTRYHQILSHPLCDKKIITASFFSPELMQVRNEWMVDNSDLLVGVWDGTPGGTGSCIAYAMKNKKSIVLMNLKEIPKP